MKVIKITLVLVTTIVMCNVVSLVAASQHEGIPTEILQMLYPDVKKFTSKTVTLNENQLKYVERWLGKKLADSEKSPTFYFAWWKPKMGPHHKMSMEEHAKMKMERIGIITFVNVEVPDGKSRAAVGITPSGEIHKYILLGPLGGSKLSSSAFLQQFNGKGVKDAFEVGKDIKAVEDMEEASQAVSTSAKKAILFLYAAFFEK